MGADLHTHSSYSDGCLRPDQLVEYAYYSGLSILALTDHDTVQGVPEAIQRGIELGVEVWPGIEISCTTSEGECHILGLQVDHNYDPLLQELARWQARREERAAQMVSRLAQLGFAIDLEQVQYIAGNGVIGRPHIAHALVERGYAADVADAFRRLIGRGCPSYVPRTEISPEHAIALIRSAGGIAVWAHPGADFSPTRLKQLQAAGLMGVEVWHPDHTPEQMLWIADQAARAGLLVTGGSDFHCADGERARLGCYSTPVWSVAAISAAKQQMA
ncbi:MAG: PHP domain-containing protein [Firmicutes bacterium]|nr:PHP domain-containing protein [Bacillota bacterium]